MDLKGKAIVITGAAQGHGQKMAEVLAARGAKVALVDVDHLKMIKDYAADVTDEQAVVALFDSLHKDFGSVEMG
jgi:3-oxoacyl-[acyl-carrier protein] reductase